MRWQTDGEIDSLASRVAERAISHGVTIGTAESCTGGLVAHLLSRLPGVSAVFLGGIVAYSNAAKHDLLDVDYALLDTHGAVSAQVAQAMAVGAREALGVQLAVSTTGIAGPGGSTGEKPVGLIYVASYGARFAECSCFRFSGNRAENVLSAALEALRLLDAALSTEIG